MKPKTRKREPEPSRGIGKVVYRTGRSVYRYRWTAQNGKREVATFDTLGEAEAFRLSILADPSRDVSSRTSTFASWWEQWMGPRDLTDSTRKVNESLATNHILPALGQVRLGEVKASHLTALRSRIVVDKGLSEATADKALQQVGACLQAAVADGILTANPSRAMARNRRSNRTKNDKYALSVSELIALEDAMDDRWAILVPFIAETGLRIGEVAALTVADVDLGNGRVRVDKSRKKTGELGPPKSKSGYRTVPTLTALTCTKLRTMITERGLTPRETLFTGTRGGVLNQDTFRARVFRPAAVAAGLDRLADGRPTPTPHTLRHTAITMWMQRAHLSPYQAAKLAGHGSSMTTERIYAHLNPGELGFVRDAMEGWGRADLRAVNED